MRAVQGSFRLREKIEDAREQFGGDADARIPHPQHRLVAFLLNGEPDVSAVGRVFGGIGEQVDHHLFQPGGVGMEPDRLRRQRHREFMPALVHQRAGRLHRTFHNAVQGDPFLLKMDSSRGDPGDFQQIINQVGSVGPTDVQ